MIAVLDYGCSRVSVLHEPSHLQNNEDVEQWLKDEGFRTKDCYWMSCVDSIDIRV